MKDEDFKPEDRAIAIKYCEFMKEDPQEVITFLNPFGLDRIKGPRWMSHMRRVWSHRAMNEAIDRVKDPLGIGL